MEIIIAFVVLIAFLVLGIPVAYSFFVSCFLLIALFGYDPSFIISNGYTKIGSIVLLVIPMFILAGGIIERGKIGVALIDFLNKFVGRVKGSLAIVGIVASAVFGAISGSGVATLTCIGSIVSPRMHDAKYPPGNIGAIFANAAPLSFLIPPSAIQILYAWTTGQSVLACFLATVIPGVMLTTLLCIVNCFLLRKAPDLEVEPKQSFREWKVDLWPKTKTAFPALLLPVLILGGIYGGLITPTEAAAMSVVYAAIVAVFIYKALNWSGLLDSLVDAGATTGVIMFAFFSAVVLSKILVLADLPTMVMELLLSISTNKIVILIMINIFLIIIGMLMDDMSGILLCAPILLPVVGAIGVSPIQFAAIIGVNLGMANVTPPSAPFLYMACRTCNCKIKDMLFPTLMMILFAWLPTLIITTYIPAVSLFLPRVILGLSF